MSMRKFMRPTSITKSDAKGDTRVGVPESSARSSMRSLAGGPGAFARQLALQVEVAGDHAVGLDHVLGLDLRVAREAEVVDRLAARLHREGLRRRDAMDDA